MNLLINNYEEPIIIFGANGFLGSVLTRNFHESGLRVLPIVRTGSDKSKLGGLKNLKILEVNIKEWPKVITNYSPSAVICAQWNGVTKKDRNNFEIQMQNVAPILDLAIAANKSRVKTFLCLGSQAEVKESNDSIQEIFYNTGKSSYGIIKAKLYSQLVSFFKNSNCRFIWARIFSVYGPTDLSDSLPMQLFNSEKTRSDFTIFNPLKFWSYLYEDDFSSAIELILKHETISGIINVGNPNLNKVEDIVSIWQGFSPIKPVNYDSKMNVSGFFPETNKLSTIGWQPSISLEEGLKRTRNGFIDRFNSTQT